MPADSIKEVNPKDVKLYYTAKTRLGPERLEVASGGVTIVTFQLDKYDAPQPTIMQLTHFFALKLKEARKIGASVLIEERKTFQDTYLVERYLGIHDPGWTFNTWIQKELLISPDRVRVVQDKQTKAVLLFVDGLEIMRREKGELRDRTISGLDLDILYKKMITPLELAISEKRLVKVGLASGIWDGTSLSSPLEKSSKPAVDDNLLQAARLRLLEEKREELVKELKKLDSELDALEDKAFQEEKPSGGGNHSAGRGEGE